MDPMAVLSFVEDSPYMFMEALALFAATLSWAMRP